MIGKLLNGVTANGNGPAVDLDDVLTGDRTFMASVVGSGAVAATVAVQGSHDGVNWKQIASYTLSGTNSASDGSGVIAAWPMVRGVVSGISGTGAAVMLTVAGTKQ